MRNSDVTQPLSAVRSAADGSTAEPAPMRERHLSIAGQSETIVIYDVDTPTPRESSITRLLRRNHPPKGSKRQ